MKLVLNQETKRVPDLKDYQELLGHLSTAFRLDPETLTTLSLKLYYLDEDEDVICVTNQADLDEAFSVCPKLKLALAPSSVDAMT